MRRRRIGLRSGLVVAGILLCLVLASGGPSVFRSLPGFRKPMPVFATVSVRKTDLTTLLTASGRVDSSERTAIECRLERLDAGVQGNSIGAGGASTVLSVLPEGSEVKEGEILCVLDSSNYEDLVTQQTMTVERSKADHLAARLNLEIASTALQEYRDGLMLQNREELKSKIALANSDVERAKDRLAWSRRVLEKGYVSQGQITSEEFSLQKSTSALANGREELRMFDQFFAPKYIHILESEIVGAEAILKFQDARLYRNQDRLDRCKTQVERCTIRAPHDGFLIYANEERRAIVIEPGMVVRERQRLFYLPDLSKMEVETFLHESVVGEVKPGMAAKVTIEGLPDRILEGHVTSIGPLPGKQDFFSDVNYFTGIVTLDVIPRGLKPGMSAEVRIRTMQRPSVLAIPTEALTVEHGKDVCYVASTDHIERREVKLGQHTRDLLEVTDGLEEGDEVVLDPRNTEAPALSRSDLPSEQAEPSISP